MALFGSGGFFDTFVSSVKDDPFKNLATGGLYGVGKGFKENPQDLFLPGLEDTAKSVGKATKFGIGLLSPAMESFKSGFGMQQDSQGNEISSELAVKDELRRESDLIKARQTRARAGNLLSSQNNMPSLLG